MMLAIEVARCERGNASRVHALIVFWALLYATFSTAAAPDHTWTGASSALWSDATNWSPASVPSNGETLLFPPTAPAHLTSTNDLPGLVVDTLLFTGSSYTFNGAGIVLSGGIESSGGNETIALPIDVQANAVTITHASNGSCDLTLTGALSGSGPIGVAGCDVTWSGTLDAYTGTIAGTAGAYLTTTASSAAAVTFINGYVVRLSGASLPNATVQDGGGNTYVLGNGTIGAVTTKNVSPYYGVLRTGDLTVKGGSVTLHNLGSATADRLEVSGTVNLDPATTLNTYLAATFVPIVGQELVLIDNDGNEPINGIFANLPEGAIITSSFVPYQLTYHGGDGNDIVLIAYPGQSATTTTITSISPATPVVGQDVSVTYTITSGQNPSGNVTVTATTGETCTNTVAAGHCTLIFPTAGPRSLTAAYGGDANNGASSSQPMPLGVDPASTTTSLLSATPNPSLVGESVVVTATIGIVAPGNGVPTGTIAISAPDSAGCTIVLPGTTCALTFSASGAKTIDAHYSGAADFLASTAASLGHAVNDPPTIDLAITIDDTVSFAQGGESTTYSIVVQNNGSADSHHAAVQNVLPANLSGATWTCASVGMNATCSASGTGSILDFVELPAGTAVIYQLTADVVPLPEQLLVQTASVSVAPGETDADPANNTATDIDVIGIFQDGFDTP